MFRFVCLLVSWLLRIYLIKVMDGFGGNTVESERRNLMETLIMEQEIKILDTGKHPDTDPGLDQDRDSISGLQRE